MERGRHFDAIANEQPQKWKVYGMNTQARIQIHSTNILYKKYKNYKC